MLENIAAVLIGFGFCQIGAMAAIAANKSKWWGLIAGLPIAIGFIIYFASS